MRFHMTDVDPLLPPSTSERLAAKPSAVRERYLMQSRLAAAGKMITTMPSRHGFNLAWLVLALIVIPPMALLIFALVRPSPVAYTNIPFPTNNNEVPAGTEVQLTQRRCTAGMNPVQLTVATRLVNAGTGAIVLELPTTTRISDPGCQEVPTVVTIPRTAPVGTYRLEGITIVQSTFRSWPLPWYSMSFLVTPLEQD